MMRTILTIGGSDPAGCSGVQADLRTIAALGLHGASVITAVTAQNTQHFDAAHPVDASTVAGQLAMVGQDLDIAAVKIGMLGSGAVAQTVAQWLDGQTAPVVVDPVLSSTTGGDLLDEAGVRTLVQAILPRASLVTPNLLEAAALAHTAPLQSPEDTARAARALVGAGCAAVLIKVGHYADHQGQDLLVYPQGERVWADGSLPAPHARGTGCVLSTAIACFLGQGHGLTDAVQSARTLIRRLLPHGYAVGAGPGPLDLFHLGVCAPAQRPEPAQIGRLHVITDTELQSRFSAEELARLAAEGGADVVQFRAKTETRTQRLVEVGQAVANACATYGAASIINDRADVALAVGATGVHLGNRDLPAGTARRIIGPTAWMGATANSVEEARALAGASIDYLGVGPVYGTTSKENPAPDMGLTTLAAIVGESQVPVIAIGGILPEHIPELWETGVHGVAVLSGVCCAPDPGAAASQYRQAIQSCLGEKR